MDAYYQANLHAKLSEQCENCIQKDTCDKKRMVNCLVAHFEYKEPIMAKINQPIMQPIKQDIMVKHDYRNIKIGENTTVTIDLEEMKKRLVETHSIDIFQSAT